MMIMVFLTSATLAALAYTSGGTSSSPLMAAHLLSASSFCPPLDNHTCVYPLDVSAVSSSSRLHDRTCVFLVDAWRDCIIGFVSKVLTASANDGRLQSEPKKCLLRIEKKIHKNMQMRRVGCERNDNIYKRNRKKNRLYVGH